MRACFSKFLLVITGIIGAAGEAHFLRHTLIDVYPYKLMDWPPWTFYEQIAK